MVSILEVGCAGGSTNAAADHTPYLRRIEVRPIRDRRRIAPSVRMAGCWRYAGAAWWCQTNSNTSRQGQCRCPFCRSETTPFARFQSDDLGRCPEAPERAIRRWPAALPASGQVCLTGVVPHIGHGHSLAARRATDWNSSKTEKRASCRSLTSPPCGSWIRANLDMRSIAVGMSA